MKNILLIISCVAMILCSCSTYEQALKTQCLDCPVEQGNYKHADRLKPLFDELLSHGVPGVAVAIYSPEGSWEYASGLAKIEDRSPMTSGHLHYLQSIAKTYLAVAVLQLHEAGKITLDAPITQYLSTDQHKHITRAQDMTVRMLLNHTSGMAEYNSDPGYLAQLLQHPDRYFTAQDFLEVISGKPVMFEPGSRYAYCNMNYEVLALITDAITGDHTRFITEQILKPLALNATYYRNEAGYLTYDRLYNAYWDRYSDGILENVSQMQRTNVSTMVGDDGIVSTPMDAVLFLKGLVEQKLIKKETLAMMHEGFANDSGKVEYGLGLDHGVFADYPAVGHSGGGLGAGCQLYYFPHNDTYFFLGINMGTVTGSPIQDKALPVLNKVHAILAE